MKKLSNRKLALSRETLRRIEPAALPEVVGGSVIDHTVYHPARSEQCPEPILV